MNELMASVRATPTPYGTAALWWLGQMSLIVKLGDTVLSVDYYAADDPDRLVKPPVPMDEVTGVDAFLGTHDHIDHIDHKAWRVWAKTCPDAVFVFPSLHREAVLADGVDPAKAVGLDGGDSCRIGDVTVRCIPAAHEFLDRDPATGRYPHLQYVIEGNGLRIWHAGDTVRYEGMVPALRALGPIDAALLPINGRDGRRYRGGFIGNMTFQEAADAAGELGVGLAIPGHWDMFAANPGDPEAFADYLDAKYGGKVPCRIPRYAEPIPLTKAD
ncbi:MAG: MBL fold metallo-hydrolase [Clostridia bacterium]|nr:MBL fold metallo-hydrolase [Clostridia bacterium]